LVQCQPLLSEVPEQLSQVSVRNGRPWWAAEFWQFCRGKLQNCASWPAQFGNCPWKTVGLKASHYIYEMFTCSCYAWIYNND